MALNTLHDLMIDELKDLYSAETQLVKALPKMVAGASTPSLKKAIGDHLEQTKGQLARLEQIFEMLDTSPRGKKCKAMEGLCEEGAEMVGEEGEDVVRDAGIIAAAQRVEHYEIAAYGSTIAFARQMGHDDIAAILQETLDEEKSADTMLSGIAESEINPAANAMGGMEESDEDDEEDGAVAAKGAGRSSKAKPAGSRKVTTKAAAKR
jgi:ferritin-like metal-binding protein YciE